MSESQETAGKLIGRPPRTGPFVGENLRKARVLADLTISEVAERVTKRGYSVTAATVRRWERSEFLPRDEAISILCAIFRVEREHFTRAQDVVFRRAKIANGKKAKKA